MSTVSPEPLRSDPRRLARLHRLDILDSPAEESFDRLTRFAAQMLGAPVALVSLVDADRQFFKSQCGLPEPWASQRETPMAYSFCQHVVESCEPLLVEDARLHPVLKDSLGTLELGVVAYAGVPLALDEGHVLGTVCVIDSRPRCWTDADVYILREIASSVVAQISLRQEVKEHRLARSLLEAEQGVLEGIGRGAPLPQLLEVLAREIEGQTDGGLCSILLLDTGTKTLRLAAAPGLPRGYIQAIDGISIGDAVGSCGADVYRNPSVIAHDGQRDPLWRALRTLGREHGLAACWSHPVRGTNGSVLGTVAIYAKHLREPDHHERAAVERGARLAALAIERNRSEELLRENEERFRQLAEHVDQAFWIFDTEFTQTLYVSPAYERIFGRSAATLYEDPRSFLEVVHPEDVDHLVFAMSQIPKGGGGAHEYRICRPQGEERLLRSHAFPVRDSNGAVHRVVGTTEDITTERARERMMPLLKAALESFEEGVSLSDPDLRVLYANAAWKRILGIDPSTMPQLQIEALLPDEEAGAQLQEIRRTLAEGRRWSGRVRRRVSDGRIIHLDLLAGVVGGPTGERNLFFVLHDATEDISREQLLRRTERLASLGTLVGGVSHELNNPLHAIRGLSEILLMGETSPERREDLKTIGRETERMAKIVSDLRLVAQRSREDDPSGVQVDLNDLVRHVMRTRAYALSTRNIEVHLDLAPNLPPVWGYPGQLEQSVLNLVINAEQAMTDYAREKRLLVETHSTGQGVRLRIADTGIGIPQENLDRIFDPFFTTREPGHGTGLGLSLVHGIMTEHGGEIRVQSKMGAGTEFRIDLPAAPVERAWPVGAKGASPQRLLRVLVVDDEVANRRVLARFLQTRGHQTAEAADGSIALEMIATNEYDVIVSDLRMPGLGGEQLLARLRAQGGGMDRRLMFLTGDAASEDTVQVLEASQVPVLLKPIDLTDVAVQIESYGERVYSQA